MQNVRATVIAALAIPASIIATFAAMDYAGITLNGPSMLGLTLSVGIVIDDAIVVLENIFRYIEEKGYGPFEAAIEATREIGLAVMATTLSLVVIFLPVAFMPSVAGRFFKSIALTMSFAIMVSLLVSFTLTPMLSARLLRRLKRKADDEPAPTQKAATKSARHEAHPEKQAPEKQAPEKQAWIMRLLDGGYTRLLEAALHHRWVVVLLAVITFASIGPLFKSVGKDFFVQDDQDEFEMSVRAPEGTSLQATLALAQKIAKDVREKLPHVNYTITTIGDDQQRTPNLAKIYVRLDPLKQRDVTQVQVMGMAREKVLPNYAAQGLRTSVDFVAVIGGNSAQNADLSFRMSGPDLDKLDQYSKQLLAKIRQMPGVVDANTSLIIGKPELRAQIDRAKAADLGVNVSDVAQSLRLLVGGDQVSTYNEGGEQYEVHVRANQNFRTDASSIAQLNVPSTRGGSVGLDSIVKLGEASGPTQIERSSRQRQVLITGNLKPGFSQSTVKELVGKEVAAMNLPAGYRVSEFGRVKEMTRTMKGFMMAFGLSFIFMYIVLAAQFESFIHPVTVLLALPLSMPFAIISLIVTGQSFNMFTMLGLLVLFGMVKKNSILQIDHANGLRKKGMERHAAMIQSSRDRLRPILMTTIAFVAGMAPLAWSSGAGAGINRSTSVVVIGGQSLCLLLTLLVTPVAYSLFDDAVNSRFWTRLRERTGMSVDLAKQKAATAASSLLSLFGK
jgi:HAE1 family hydrophobic/amphiphilic exporter-1